MESWLLDVKKVRIPRPKFASSRSYPVEPPKDYYEDDDEGKENKRDLGGNGAEMAKATEELRRAVQDKL